MNRHIHLRPAKVGSTCPSITGADTIRESYAEYSSDESKKTGCNPERIFFPETADEVSAAVAEIAKSGGRATVSGARTGIAGGAVASAENLLSVSRIRGPVTVSKGEGDRWFARVPSSLSLDNLSSILATKDVISEYEVPDNLFYPVDPTEKSASIGGTVATNASGARTLKYGPTRDWVRSIDIVLADGSACTIERGKYLLSGKTMELKRKDGSSLLIPIENIPWPDTKHTAGYYMRPGMDPIDLFIGAEGTLGIVTQVELALSARPAQRLGLFLFLKSDIAAQIVPEINALSPAAVEYMDRESLELLKESRRLKIDGGTVPELPGDAGAAIYVEIEAESEEAIEEVYEALLPLFEKYDIPEDHTWAGFSDHELDRMKAFRHALPERVNNIIAERKRSLPSLTKIGTDMAVPLHELRGMLDLYKHALDDERIEYCIFGHIGNGHVHVNILPKSMDERKKGYTLYRDFARHAVACGGSVAGEHGIGSLKREFMEIQFSKDQLDSMIAVKRALDPALLLNPGVIFDLS